jgi:hypothetical protein
VYVSVGLKTKNRGECLDSREIKQQEAGRNCTLLRPARRADNLAAIY